MQNTIQLLRLHRFLHGLLPEKIEKTENGKLLVTYASRSEEFDTVMYAVGRDPCTRSLNLDAIGITLSPTEHILVDSEERTDIDNIFAIGDVIRLKTPSVSSRFSSLPPLYVLE